MKHFLEVSISPHRELRLTAPAHNRNVPMKPFHQVILTSAPLNPGEQHFPPEMHLRLGWAAQGLQLLTGTRSPKSNPGDTKQKVFFSSKAPQQQHVPRT